MKTNILKNKNGNSYVILERKNDLALLAQIYDENTTIPGAPFVVASDIRDNWDSWGGASYWEDLESALNRYKELQRELFSES